MLVTSSHHSRSLIISTGRILFSTVTTVSQTPATNQVKSFDQVPKLKQSSLKYTLKSLLQVFGKHKKDFHRDEYFENVYKKYGPVVSRGEPFGPAHVHLFDPNDIATVFKNEDLSPHRIAFDTVRLARERIKDVLKKPGIVESNGSEWYNLRKRFQTPLLRTQNVDKMCPIIDSVAYEFVKGFDHTLNKNGEFDNLVPELYKWTTESVGAIVFDHRLGALEQNLSPTSETYILLEAIKNTFLMTFKCELGLPWYKLFPTPNFRSLVKSQRIMTEAAMKYVNLMLEKIKDMDENSIQNTNFLMQMLYRKEVDFDDAVAMILDILFGAIDTTSHSTAMLFYHLSRHSAVQEKLHREVSTVCPDPSVGITADQLNKMPYLKACVKETHRLTPAVDALSRVIKKDLVLSGYRIPAGTNVILHHRTMGRIHFENPTQFLPDRWLRAEGESRKFHMFVWLPFGHGLRGCIGKRIALEEAEVLTARVIQKYKLTFNGDEEVRMISQFVNIPDKIIRVKFNKREVT